MTKINNAGDNIRYKSPQVKVVVLTQLSIPEKFSKKSPLPEVRRRHTPFFLSL